MRKCLWCQQAGEPLYLCFGCDLFMKEHNGMSEKQTNADRIRSMSDEELAEWIAMHDMETYYNGRLLPDQTLEWLRSEAKE